MSGGSWTYQEEKIAEAAYEYRKGSSMYRFMMAVSESEHICDWAEACDTSRESAEKNLYDLWVKTFNQVFGRTGITEYDEDDEE